MNLSEYEWPRPHGFTPFEHQKTTSEFLTINRKAFCFNEQGTGKTASVIWAVDYLMTLKLVTRVLVVCPLSIMKSAWQADLFKFAIHRTCDVAYGDANRRKKLINNGAEFVIINYDGLTTIADELLNNGSFDLIVIVCLNDHTSPRYNRLCCFFSRCRLLVSYLLHRILRFTHQKVQSFMQNRGL